MPKFQRKSVIEQTADLIQQSIKDEAWTGLLPSIRTLCTTFGLSLPTVHKALHLLVQRGVLRTRGDKRRLQIVAESVGVEPERPRFSVLCFMGMAPEKMVSAAVLGLAETQITLRESGHVFRQVSLHGLGAEETKAAIRQAIRLHQPSHCILVFGNREMYVELSRGKAKLAVMGGDMRTTKTVRLGIRYGRLVDHAVRQLAAAGHRRIFMPCLGRPSRPYGLLEELPVIEREHGVVIDFQWHRERTPERLAEVFDSALSRSPTAILFPQSSDVAAAAPYLERRRLTIPADLSAAVLVYGPYIENFPVKLAHFSVTPNAFHRQVMTWLESDRLDHEFINAQMISRWDSGESIGTPEA